MNFRLKTTCSFLFYFLICCLLSIINSFSQEINASIKVDYEQIQSQEKSVFTSMQASIQQFINTRKWTNDKFSPNERIKMNLNIKLQEMPSIGTFKAAAQVQFSRPVYGTSYESMTLNFLDNDFDFDYVQNQTLEYNDNTYTTNLTSLIAFFIYIGIGFDYDSFSKLGGSPYFEKAQLVLNNAQSAPYDGWRQTGSNPNSRYWLNDNINSPTFKEFRENTYVYYRQGLDELATKPDESRAKIIEVISVLKRTNDTKPNSCLLRTYFNSKDNELIKILAEASPPQKTASVEMLRAMDPTNTDNYEKLLK